MNVDFTQRDAGVCPLLIARSDNEQRGTVIWYHGLGVDKETHRSELERFALAGFTAVGVDAVDHGARRAADLDIRTGGTQEEALHVVVDLAQATAAELPALIDQLVTDDIADRSRVAIAGISMGAFVVYRALTGDVPLRAAVAILGSPEWPVKDSPHVHAAEFCRVPLLSITASEDVNVPAPPARRLHMQLERTCADRHRYVELEGAAHLMNEQHWETTMRATIDWLTDYLPEVIPTPHRRSPFEKAQHNGAHPSV